MDSATAADEPQRAKFLCSFGGGILPRPVDGRLRYVGGETRIVALPRDITFDDLLARMRELFDGATVIKYQQPDEDLDALVSVVNNDDVVNMMEEYDKLASTVSGDGGIARLRIFLSTHHNPDPDAAAAAAAAHFDVDERVTERRYVDALNSLGGSSSSPDVHEHYLGPGLHQLNISYPHPHPHARHSEVESSWNSPYFLPGRDLRESPNSPSSAVQLDQQASPMMENNKMWTSAGAVVPENAGFPGNLGHSHNGFDGSSITCEHCRIAYPRYLDPKWNGGSEYMGQFSGSCADCYANRELPSSPFVNEDHHGHDHGWLPHPHHQSIQRGVEDPRIYLSGTGGRVGDQYVVDGNMMNSPFDHGNLYDGYHDDGRYLRPPAPPVNDFGGERLNLQQGAVHGNHYPSHYGAENPNPYQVPRNLPPVQNFQRNLQVTVRPLMMSNGFVRSAQEVSPRFSRLGLEDQSQHPWKAHNDNLSLKHCGADHHNDRLDVNIVNQVIGVSDPSGVNVRARIEDPKEDILNMKGVTPTEAAKLGEGCNASPGCLTYLPKLVASGKNTVLENVEEVKTRAEENPTEAAKLGEGCNASPECLAYLPELVASVKNTVLENVEEVKTRAEENPTEQKEPSPEVGLGNGQAELDAVTDGDADHNEVSKIETTTAEADALAQGLQTIKNDDLEEIRELGSGTYGSVYHGKWKGSDVAVKRIKASCFTGKPSERERLIADFWKEALILSSLHHPNVVSFYGVVRDGPDGSLATVTEFMVNGSLKQFLQKKDRTIDRRKRLIIAMDAAFGMEYLHAKNIVHFDLKCENLLVNMRDPQRPICKIGDLGLSKVKQHTLVSGGVRGTLPWMAPELLSGKKNMVTEKVDVYSFGIVMWELLTGEEPYGDMHCGSIIGGIMSNTLRPQIPTWCDPEWRSLVESCWSSTPAERPSFSEISQKLRKMAAAINVK